jgi:hypothetical protein
MGGQAQWFRSGAAVALVPGPASKSRAKLLFQNGNFSNNFTDTNRSTNKKICDPRRRAIVADSPAASPLLLQLDQERQTRHGGRVW